MMKTTCLFLLAVVTTWAQSTAFSFVQDVKRVSPSTKLSMTIEENAQKKEVNVGVIGCGRIGIVHLGAISKAPGVKAVIVSNPTVSKAEAGELY